MCFLVSKIIFGELGRKHSTKSRKEIITRVQRKSKAVKEKKKSDICLTKKA
jgi:hypothetical protein